MSGECEECGEHLLNCKCGGEVCDKAKKILLEYLGLIAKVPAIDLASVMSTMFAFTYIALKESAQDTLMLGINRLVALKGRSFVDTAEFLSALRDILK